jgi:hypothetical protein
VPDQLVDHPATLDIPEAANHVVGHTRDNVTIWCGGHGADPFAVSIHLADFRTRLDVPPDQAAVVTAGDQRRASKGHAGHVAIMTAQLDRLGLGLVQIDLVDRKVRAAAENPARARFSRQGEHDIAA